jgi:anti-sigma factor RsiW
MTNAPGRHPEDLSPYLDGDVSDPGYQAIRHHLDQCPACTEEVENWKSWQAMFRAPEVEITVPDSQWRRIATGIEERKSRKSRWERWFGITRPAKLAWGTAGALVLAAGMLISGLEYREYSEERRQLTALSAYSEAEQEWLAQAENPFRSQDSNENPFRRADSKNGNYISR